LVSGGEDGTVALWDTTSSERLLTFKELTQGVSALALSPDGQTILAGGRDGIIKLWSALTERKSTAALE
jgi:WD40 repeat protein